MIGLLAQPWFTVTELRDPLVTTGPATDSDTALTLLCPVLGPTSTLMLHTLARTVRTAGTTTPAVASDTWPARFGVKTEIAAKSLLRLDRFGFARIYMTRIEVRLVVPPLPDRWNDRYDRQVAA